MRGIERPCLSTNHFGRGLLQVFKPTPHRHQAFLALYLMFALCSCHTLRSEPASWSSLLLVHILQGSLSQSRVTSADVLPTVRVGREPCSPLYKPPAFLVEEARVDDAFITHSAARCTICTVPKANSHGNAPSTYSFGSKAEAHEPK